LNPITRIAIFHFIFIAWAAFLNQMALGFIDFQLLSVLQNSTFWFFAILSSILVWGLCYIFSKHPKLQTSILLGSFSLKFIVVATAFLILIYLNKEAVKTNKILAVLILIVNYLLFTFWILFVYFRLNKLNFDQ